MKIIIFFKFPENTSLPDDDDLQALKPTGLTTDFQTQYQ